MSHLYTTKVTAVGGRNGIVKSDDGILDLPPPPAMRLVEANLVEQHQGRAA